MLPPVAWGVKVSTLAAPHLLTDKSAERQQRYCRPFRQRDTCLANGVVKECAAWHRVRRAHRADMSMAWQRHANFCQQVKSYS